MPKLTGQIVGTTVNRGTLNATTPRLSGAITGELTNPATLTATTPTLQGSIIGTATLVGYLAAILPLITGRITDAGPVVFPPIPDRRVLTGAGNIRTLTPATRSHTLAGHAPTRSLKGAP